MKEREGGRERESGREREGERGGQGSPIKKEPSECTWEVLLVSAAEDISFQDPKGRPVQMREC